jgi:putative ABC transport system permease protein
MSLLAQSLVVSRLSLASLRQRGWSALVIVVGTACTIGVLLAMLSVTAGLLRAARAGGDPFEVIIHSQQSSGEFGGGISRADVATILSAPGIAKGADGKPIGDAQLVRQLPPAAGFAEGSLQMRGIGPGGPALHRGFHILAGRMFRPGLHELVVGTGANRQFDLKVGDRMILPDGDWPIVGVFSAQGGSVESLLLADAKTLMTSMRASDFGSVLVRLEDPSALGKLQQWLSSNPTLSVVAERQTDYYLRMVAGPTQFYSVIALVVGVMLGVGALFGSVNIMYGAVNARTREIATLRAVGYEPLPIGISVILEAILLACAGAALGCGISWWVFNGKLNSIGSQIFANAVSPRLVAIGFGWAISIAVLGAMLPAVRAGRLAVAQALRPS